MRRAAAYILSLIAILPLWAQFDFGEYLQSTASDEEIRLLEAQVDFMENENFNLPILRGVEVRLRSSNTNETVEDYRFRLEFLNPFERAANKKYNRSFQQKLELEQAVRFADVLLLRYQLLVRHFELNDELSRIDERMTLVNTLYLLAEQNRDAEDLLDANLELTKLELRKGQVQNDMSALNNRIHLLNPGLTTPTWQEFRMITPEIMSLVLSGMDSLAVPMLELLDQESDLAQKEYKLEKANTRRAIGFIQSEYDWDRGNWPREHWGFQVGIAIPIVNPDRPNLQYDKLDIMELESESRVALESYQRRMSELTGRFKTTKQGFDLVDQKLQSTESTEGTLDDDKLNLEFYKFRKDLEELRSEYHVSLLNTYLQILHLRGALAPTNPVNYLSSTSEGY